jgi:hypothetical protein
MNSAVPGSTFRDLFCSYFDRDLGFVAGVGRGDDCHFPVLGWAVTFGCAVLDGTRDAVRLVKVGDLLDRFRGLEGYVVANGSRARCGAVLRDLCAGEEGKVESFRQFVFGRAIAILRGWGWHRHRLTGTAARL